MTKYEAMEAVMAPLWRIPNPQACGVFQHSAFKWFERHCKANHEQIGKGFSNSIILMDALCAMGLPCRQAPGLPAVDVAFAARGFVDALEAPTVTRRYFAPLNLADDLPELRFGDAQVARLTTEQLKSAIEYDRLLRQGHAPAPEIERLAQLQWLVVEQTVPTPEGLANRGSRLFHGFQTDPGAIVPHEGRYPAPVMKALFAMLLAPWEDWHDHSEYDWRSFNIPWVHVATGDIFDRAHVVPSTENLAWEPHFHGDEEVGEKPAAWPLNAAHTDILERIDESCWAMLENARHTVLFETPVEHFMLRAYFSEGMDEIIAHMIAIEAALGLQSDFTKAGRRRVPGMPPTTRVMKRLAALLNDPAAAETYDVLCKTRGEFIHGRKIEEVVPSKIRNCARRLARRVAVALVEKSAKLQPDATREEFLTGLC